MSLLDTQHKKKSFTLTTVLLSVLVLLLFYIGLTYFDPPIENGITVNFGSMEFGMGDNQPPRNMNAARAETRIMLAYSARKNTANAVPEYST